MSGILDSRRWRRPLYLYLKTFDIPRCPSAANIWSPIKFSLERLLFVMRSCQQAAAVWISLVTRRKEDSDARAVQTGDSQIEDTGNANWKRPALKPLLTMIRSRDLALKLRWSSPQSSVSLYREATVNAFANARRKMIDTKLSAQRRFAPVIVVEHQNHHIRFRSLHLRVSNEGGTCDGMEQNGEIKSTAAAEYAWEKCQVAREALIQERRSGLCICTC